jgi:hypothetical protein
VDRRPPAVERDTIAGVFAALLTDPWRSLVWRWNYKSAIFSAAIRSLLFLVVNLRAGVDAATAAMATEAAFRVCTAGFYGALTQAFRRAEPRWAASACALIVVPGVAHVLELAVHWWRGTPELARSITASVALSLVSTGFSLFAMRRGSFAVGPAAPSMLADLRALPTLVRDFTLAVGRGVLSACR